MKMSTASRLILLFWLVLSSKVLGAGMLVDDFLTGPASVEWLDVVGGRGESIISDQVDLDPVGVLGGSRYMLADFLVDEGPDPAEFGVLEVDIVDGQWLYRTNVETEVVVLRYEMGRSGGPQTIDLSDDMAITVEFGDTFRAGDTGRMSVSLADLNGRGATYFTGLDFDPFETLRVPVSDIVANSVRIDLDIIRYVTVTFGGLSGSPEMPTELSVRRIAIVPEPGMTLVGVFGLWAACIGLVRRRNVR